jgi:hypothetical protein
VVSVAHTGRLVRASLDGVGAWSECAGPAQSLAFTFVCCCSIPTALLDLGSTAAAVCRAAAEATACTQTACCPDCPAALCLSAALCRDLSQTNSLLPTCPANPGHCQSCCQHHSHHGRQQHPPRRPQHQQHQRPHLPAATRPSTQQQQQRRRQQQQEQRPTLTAMAAATAAAAEARAACALPRRRQQQPCAMHGVWALGPFLPHTRAWVAVQCTPPALLCPPGLPLVVVTTRLQQDQGERPCRCLRASVCPPLTAGAPPLPRRLLLPLTRQLLNPLRRLNRVTQGSVRPRQLKLSPAVPEV